MKSIAQAFSILFIFTCTACSHGSESDLSGVAQVHLHSQVGQIDAGSSRWVFLPPTDCLNFGIASDGSSHMWLPAACGRLVVRHRFIIRIALDGSQLKLQTPTAESCPGGLGLGPNGNMWFAEGCVGKLGEVALPSGPITEFPLLSAKEEPCCVTAGADRNVWFGALYRRAAKSVVGKMTTNGAVTEFPLAKTQLVTAIALGPDGNVWFAGSTVILNAYQGYVGRVTPAGAVSEYAIPSANGGVPGGIVSAPDGNLWVAAANGVMPGGEIIKVTTSGQMTEYLTNTATSIALGNKRSLYFAAVYLDQITFMGLITIHNQPGVTGDYVAQAPDGNEWLVQSGGSGGVFVYLLR